MIKNIIFDFGDVFINLDKEIIFREIIKYGGDPNLSPEMLALNASYEIGKTTSEDFITQLSEVYPKANKEEIKNIWNSMLLDFPDYRLDFLEELAEENNYRLFLLSNTNDLHITKVKEKMGAEKYIRFKNCFEKFYLSHEIHLRKPNANIYEFVVEQNDLVASETLFIDDTKENTDSAKNLGIHSWHLKVGQEDVTELSKRI